MRLRFHYINIADDVVLYENEPPSDLGFVLIPVSELGTYLNVQNGIKTMWFSEYHVESNDIAEAEYGMISHKEVEAMIKNYQLPNWWKSIASRLTTDNGDQIPHLKTLDSILPVLEILLKIRYYI